MQAPAYMSAARQYGLPNTITAVDSPLETVAGPTASQATEAKHWHPDSPLFWVGVIALVAFGAAFASTSVRVGPVRANASVGKP